MPRTKIIATVGPASSSESVLRKMFISGLDVVRLNFSHGSHSDHLERIRIVRNLNKKMRRAIKIMQDLEGYRIRVGRLEGPVQLKKGACVELTQEEIVGDGREIPFDYHGSLKRIKCGTLIYIDDGKMMLEVRSVRKRRLKARVGVGGMLSEHKGINIPGVRLDFEAITEKDRKDIQVGIAERLDFVAQSFVRTASDVKLVKDIIKPLNPNCQIFAKIESRDALSNMSRIIEEADGIIIARGDLGICVPIYMVPVIQKDIIKKCLLRKKPVVVATQMLESMTEERIPTRAEVSDVANAILDGATHLMLSAETAVGKYPPIAVGMMNKIINYTECYLHSQ